ncbi:hypothetical protein [Fretibacter rubidus]|uniref:hypothetical protein n=1 Tax=Fretibacter rubidus TaxID=570162 RepID=UPI00352B9A01
MAIVKRIVLPMIAAVVATYVLFVGILVLLSPDFKVQNTETITTLDSALDEDIDSVALIDVIELQKNHLDELLNPVIPPPPLNTKGLPATARLTPNPVPHDILLPASFDFGPPARTSLKPIGFNAANSDTSLDIDQDETPGFVQCDLELTLGESIRQIEQVIWKNCIGAESSDSAELAAYKWVATAPSSFLNLNPQPGDILAFSYKKALDPKPGVSAN